MNRDKQIEERARELCPFSQEYKSCSECDAEHDIDGDPCIYMIMLKRITDKGYRKANEVAREILQEVRQLLLNMVLANSMGETYDLEGKFADLEKKYESEGEG